MPAQEAAWPGARSGGGDHCESLLSPCQPQAGWVKGGCSPPASPPTWAQTMGLCAWRGRVVKVRSPGPEPWPQPPRGQGGRARGSAGAGKSNRQGSKASLRQSQQRKSGHREGAPGTQSHTAHGHQSQVSHLGRQPPTHCGLSVPTLQQGAWLSRLLKPALRGSAEPESPFLSLLTATMSPFQSGSARSDNPPRPVSGSPPDCMSHSTARKMLPPRGPT